MNSRNTALAIAFITIGNMSAFAGDRHEPPAEVRAAFEACSTELGIVKVEGQRPSDADRKKLHACVEAKGIKLPEHGPGGPGGHHGDFEKVKACLDAAGVKMPARPTDGSRPVLDDATKSAMAACKAQVSRDTASAANDANVAVGDSSSN